MVNKDQLDQSPEGKEVLALLAKHFTEEQFQRALTLIEQLYTDDQTVWDAELNHESKWPFLKTDSAHRLLVFFASPDHVAKVKDELERRAAEAVIQSEASEAGQAWATVKPKAKRKTGTARKAGSRKKAAAKTGKRKPPVKRRKLKSRPVKARKSRPKKRR